ncbi:MAG: hypothetical protein PHG48_02935, partial [Eubacteriales bacterium]|nr:hypothetical protein [Eubacteriales bacterium]
MSKKENRNETELVVYPEYDRRIIRNTDYEVTVEYRGKSSAIPVYDHSAAEANSRMSCGADMHRRFCEFACRIVKGTSIKVNVAVREDIPVGSYVVLPSSLNTKTELYGNVISIFIDKPGYYILKLNRDENTMLRIFADEPENEADIPGPDDPGVLYVEGWHETENASLVLGKDIRELYLAPGSVLFSRVRVEENGCRVTGRGMILDPYSDIFRYDLRKRAQKHFFEIVSGNLLVRDVKLVDGRAFNITMGADIVGGCDCGGCTFESIRILSSVICTDGISFWGVNNITVRKCFIECGDNALVISLGSSDITVEDTWIGTLCKAIVPTYNVGENVRLKNIYVFRAAEGLFSHFTSRKKDSFTVDHGFSMLVDGLDASDCEDFPWIFKGYNTGAYKKEITFRNFSVPLPSGSSQAGTSGQRGCGIMISNSPEFLYTENYRLVFENLVVGGRPVISAGQTDMKIDGDNEVEFIWNGIRNGIQNGTQDGIKDG